MSGALEKSLAILEYLVAYPDGVPLARIATELNQARSGCHRTLGELIRYGYVRQEQRDGHYVLTIKLVSIGLSFLSRSGIVDIAQPLLDQLAKATGELVRLAVQRLTHELPKAVDGLTPDARVPTPAEANAPTFRQGSA